MMKRMAGLLAGAALLGGIALAQQDSTPSTQGSSSQSTAGMENQGVGGSGLNQDQSTLNQQATQQANKVPGQASGQINVGEPNAQSNQLIGTVVESKSHTLYLQHMGAVVPLRIEKSTDVAGLSGKKLTDLKSGDEVQVTFQVKNKIDNVATKVGLPSATGGSGLGTYDESHSSGIGGSGSAGSSSSLPGEDTNLNKPVSPDEQNMQQPMQPGVKHDTTDQKPIY